MLKIKKKKCFLIVRGDSHPVAVMLPEDLVLDVTA